MRVQELQPGLWRWTGLHPDWDGDEDWAEEVACVYHRTEDAIVLIDPLVPPEDPETFLRALDRDVQEAGRPVHILITIFWHARSAATLVDRYPGTRVWAHEPAGELIAERAPVTDVFGAGGTLPGGVLAVDAARAYEVLFWLPAPAALVTGDVLLGDAAGGLRLCPDEWLGTRDRRDVVARLRAGLSGLPVERILPAHGEAVLTDGRATLDAALS